MLFGDCGDLCYCCCEVVYCECDVGVDCVCLWMYGWCVLCVGYDWIVGYGCEFVIDDFCCDVEYVVCCVMYVWNCV